MNFIARLMPREGRFFVLFDGHAKLIVDGALALADVLRNYDVEQRRDAGIKLIEDGDLMAAISVAVAGTGVHAVMGIGGAPEGVITAAALRCLGGEIQARFRYRSDDERERGARMGHGDEDRVYATEDLAPGENLVFAATGVTDGDLLSGVRFFGGGSGSDEPVISLIPFCRVSQPEKSGIKSSSTNSTRMAPSH